MLHKQHETQAEIVFDVSMLLKYQHNTSDAPKFLQPKIQQKQTRKQNITFLPK